MKPSVRIKAGINYFSLVDSSGDESDLYIKGVNLSAAMPGSNPWEQSADRSMYSRWLNLIAEMNANSVRVLDLMPQEFYQALAHHNLNNPGKTIWLLQGVWIELPQSREFSREQLQEYTARIANTVRGVHGSNSDHRTDVSAWLLGYVVGQEWSPGTVLRVNEEFAGIDEYNGQYIDAVECSPMESILASLCDSLLSVEAVEFGQLHPVSFVNWVQLDPIDHRRGFEERLGRLSEDVVSANTDFAENDVASISATCMKPTEKNEAGVFASYHVYPYYPDFIARQPQYAGTYDRNGPNSFLGYLRDLKSHYPDMPLLITEYGLASGPVVAHRHPEGWHHGGLSETDVSRVIPRLIEAVEKADCAGGMVFAWCDEWFKRVWLWNRLYQPAEESRFWFNSVDPEQNFGLMAVRPGASGPMCTLQGDLRQWQDATLLGKTEDGQDASLIDIKAMHDEGSLFIRIGLNDDWSTAPPGMHLFVGLDVYGQDLGNRAFPLPGRLEAAAGMEIMLHLHNGEARLLQASDFRYWESIRAWSPGLDAQTSPLGSQSSSLGWIQPQVMTNEPTLDKYGKLTESLSWPVNPLPEAECRSAGYSDPHAMWSIQPGSDCVEFRIPWILAGFSAPHRRLIIDFDESGRLEGRPSAGIGVYAALIRDDGTVLATVPKMVDSQRIGLADIYTWEDWSKSPIEFHESLKPAYFAVRNAYSEMQ